MEAFKKELPCWRKNYGSRFSNRAMAAVCGNICGAVKRFIFMMAAFLLINSCATKVKDYIPGTYTTSWSTEFTQSRDTLIIEPPTEGASIVYQITRRIYMLYLGKPQYKLVKWTGTFISTSKTVIINNNGAILSFDPARHEMKMGSAVYKKL